MKNYYKLLVITFLCSAIWFNFSTKLYAQANNIRFEHFTSAQGISQNSVRCIFQDSRGFLWLGTEDGLNRYNGYEFVIYRNMPEDKTSLSNNNVFSIYEDNQGYIWIGTYGGGLNKFDWETETFTHYKHDPNDPKSLSDNRIFSIYIDKSGVLWIGTLSGGLNKFDREKETFTHYKHDPNNPKSLSDNRIFSIYIDKSGLLWIGTLSGGLNKFDRETETFTHYKHDPNDPKSLSNNRIYSIHEDQSGVLWIGTPGGGLNKFDREKETFTHYKHDPNDPKSLSSNIVYSIYEDQSGVLWIGTFGGGLNKFDRETETFTHYKHDPNDPKSLSDNRIFSIYIDQSGLLWIGIFGGGLNKFYREKETFTHYKHIPNDPQSLSDNKILSLYEDQSGVLWIGTFGGGLNKFDREKETFTHYKHDPNDPKSLSDNEVLSIYEDPSGVLWIGTFGGGLNKFDREKETFTHYRHDPNDSLSLSNNLIYSVYEDKSGVLWIGTRSGGLNKFDREKETFTHYKYDPNDPKSLSDNRIFSIYEDQSGVLWIGTFGGGLNKFDRETETFTHYKHDPNDPKNLRYNRIISIYEDQSGVLWIGTFGGGLNKFDRDRETFQQYREKDGLLNDVIYGILEDDNRNLWLSTINGLSKFNPTTETFRNFDVRDGLQNNEFNIGASYKNKNGVMFFGGMDGFNMFHPDSIKDNTHIPPIVITEFQLNNIVVPIGFDSTTGRSILEKAIEETNEIELLHKDNVISFEFTALDYHIPEKNQFAYMMEGFDEKWNYRDADNRFVTYTNLDPGEYTFRVKGSNNDGYWNEEGASIRIIILPPWWATTWAYLIYVLILLSIIYFTWKMQLKRIRIKHDYKMSKFEAEKMHEVDEMKSRFFANISHEFRTPLTLIIGPAKDIMENFDDRKKVKQSASLIKRNASRLYGLVNQLLDLSKLEAGRMTLETREQNIIPLLKGLVLSFTSMAERKKITLKFNTIEENLNVYIDKDKVEKIVNNLLSNAFKFTPEGGTVEVTIKSSSFPPCLPDRQALPNGELKGGSVEIIISDNGVGIPKDRIDKIFDRFFQVDGSHTRESEGTGIGLALTKELVELHKGKIKVESKEGEGTTLTVLLSLGKEHLKPEEIVKKEIPEETEVTIENNELIPEMENRKEKTDIDLLLETDLSARLVSDESERADKTGKPLLLIVEDNSDVRKYIISHLEGDYRIQEAVDGEDGLAQALNHIPDLIISDVMMPKMDGFELCNKLKTDEKTSHIPIIMLTAKATSKDKIEGYETGADDYIMKPFDAAELKVRIKNLIEIRRKLQEKFSSEDFVIPKELSSMDEEFIKRVLQAINEHISEEEFSIEELGKEAAMSRKHLHRKLKALTGKSPSQFMRSLRLIKARILIKEKVGTISEISFQVGFSSPAYFNKCFKEEFGYSPGELI